MELLFKNHEFKYILKAVKKCEENLDFDLLELISINAQKLLNNPNAKKISEKDKKHNEAIIDGLKKELEDYNTLTKGGKNV